MIGSIVGRGVWLSVAVFVFGGIASVADASAALVRVPDNPLGGLTTCGSLVAQQTSLGSVNFPDSEVEPYIAVDPTKPNHLVASVQQDR